MKSADQHEHHVVILPYFCGSEVERYLKIAERISQFPSPKVQCDFLLAASPRTEPNAKLECAFGKLGRTTSFQCPTQIFGYPEGPTAMFWDCMDFIADHYENQNGFALWLESDMAPIKPDWIDRLSVEWYQDEQTPIMMGCYVPDVYTQRLLKPPKLVVTKHINGGACYAMDFAKKMPADARTGIFDIAVYQYATKLGRAKRSGQISFSTNQRVRRDLSDPNKVLLHGFMQDKDTFIDGCLKPLSSFERKLAPLNPALDRLEKMRRMIKINFSEETRETALDHVFLSIQRFEATEARRQRRVA